LLGAVNPMERGHRVCGVRKRIVADGQEDGTGQGLAAMDDARAHCVACGGEAGNLPLVIQRPLTNQL
jgi:hypothetical protein